MMLSFLIINALLMKIFGNKNFMSYKNLKITYGDQNVLAHVTIFSNFDRFPNLISLSFFN
jgi:hypothetical protein